MPDDLRELDTPRFGRVRIQDDVLVSFPRGVIGLPECRTFARIPFAEDGTPFEWFQSVDDVTVAFLTIEPQVFFPEYAVTLVPEELAEIALSDETEGEVRCIVTVPERVGDMTANLLAPIVVNTQGRTAKQVVLSDPRYATKHRLFSEAEAHAGAQPAP